MRKVSDYAGELVVIYLGKEAVGGSFIYCEGKRPRLYSQGILHNDKELLRRGVGTAVYLCSFDHLAKKGFGEVHMGWSRAVLSDGSLYFKERFGFRIEETSAHGHFLECANPSEAVNECLNRMGLVHYRRGNTRAAVFNLNTGGSIDKVLEQKQAQAIRLDLDGVDVIDSNQSRSRAFYPNRKENLG